MTWETDKSPPCSDDNPQEAEQRTGSPSAGRRVGKHLHSPGWLRGLLEHFSELVFMELGLYVRRSLLIAGAGCSQVGSLRRATALLGDTGPGQPKNCTKSQERPWEDAASGFLVPGLARVLGS